jgi:hypothetical protein
MMLAASVTYLGAFKYEQRMKVRKELAERLLLKNNIESSEWWSNDDNEQMHSKYFMKVIKNDLGISKEIFIKLNHLLIDTHFAEFLFFLIFSPTVPII